MSTKASALAAVVAMAALTACGTPVNMSVDVAAVEADLSAVNEQMVGTVAQRKAAEQLTYVRFQGQIRDCMNKAGFGYTAPPFLQTYDGREHMSTPAEYSALRRLYKEATIDSGLAVTVENERSRAYEARGVPNPGFERLNSEKQRQAYAAAGDSCQPAQETYVDLGSSKISDELRKDFFDVLQKANSRAAVKSALDRYPACMASKGVPAKDVEDLREKVLAHFNAKESALGSAAPLRQGKQGWTEVVAFEKKASLADSECRADAHTLGMSAVQPLLRDFTAEHAAELRASQAVWESVERDATAALPQLRALDPSFKS